MSLVAQNREAAYKAYATCGGNVKCTLKALKRQGITITERQLYNWIKSFNFPERLKADDALANESNPLRLIAASLMEVVSQYRSYRMSLPTGHVDPQATYAEVSALRTLQLVISKLPAKATSEAETLKIAEQILEAEYGIRRQA